MTQTTKQSKKWNDALVLELTNGVGADRPVSATTVEQVSEQLGFTVRSIASKLRNLGIEVASLAKIKVARFSEAESESLAAFVTANSGQLTYKQIAENFAGGAFSAKEIQGKLLALELTSEVKPAEKVEAARSYTESEETKFVSLANSGAFLEDIAEALGKELASVRGKALSLTRSGQITKIPTQKASHAVNQADAVDQLGDAITAMTVAEIAKAVDKTERGIKTLLTRRGIKVADYDGVAKQAKAQAKASVAAA